jgi:8-oxo-dGTP diphosphatase
MSDRNDRRGAVPPSPPVASHPELCVGAIVIDDGCLLLIRRGRGAGVGLWSVPGGRVEMGETMVAATVRELAEETGLRGEAVRHLGWVERIGGGYHFVIHDYLVAVGDRRGARAGDDAAELAWVPLERVAGLPGIVPGLADFLRQQMIAGPARTTAAAIGIR